MGRLLKCGIQQQLKNTDWQMSAMGMVMYFYEKKSSSFAVKMLIKNSKHFSQTRESNKLDLLYTYERQVLVTLILHNSTISISNQLLNIFATIAHLFNHTRTTTCMLFKLAKWSNVHWPFCPSSIYIPCSVKVCIVHIVHNCQHMWNLAVLFINASSQWHYLAHRRI